ncbi:uncharacterized protein LOC111274230 [Durio zibethinus]|uniref:Uncharacterized protein LOC111274230 n=1 Tax=Durio zibethinus TaxID=66656 RepID=A0A6P5WF02_DURZI|nr:uncharacterized protein LOC111274230 [Durio zibethinus]
MVVIIINSVYILGASSSLYTNILVPTRRNAIIPFFFLLLVLKATSCPHDLITLLSRKMQLTRTKHKKEIMKLYDSCWFEMEIFKTQKSPSTSASFEPNPDYQIEENSSKPDFTRTSTLHTRSMSDQSTLISTSFIGSDSFSPDSVLHSPKLHKIISGKEITEEELQETIQESPNKKVVASRRITRRKKGTTKSLSDLEFEELKGFMDLGFVFSEEDNKDSRLVEIIPGLQRLGRKEGEEDSKEADDKVEVSRPYLSEAWELSERRRKENPLMNWKVPALGNEIDIKDSLRWWAHTVASTNNNFFRQRIDDLLGP